VCFKGEDENTGAQDRGDNKLIEKFTKGKASKFVLR